MPTLDPSELTRPLATAGVPWQIACLSECDSTNREAIDRCIADPSLAKRGLVVLSEWQSAGRGRRGARWSSRPSQDLLLSVAIQPDMPPETWGRLTHAAALGACESLEPEFEPQIKWPNDIYIGESKVAGILLESQPASGLAVVGIGLNVNSNPADLPPDLAAPATSLWAAAGSPAAEIAREPLAVKLLAALYRAFARSVHDFPQLLAEIGQRSLLLGRDISLTLPDGEPLTGRATGFGPEGELQLQPPDSPPRSISSATQVRSL